MKKLIMISLILLHSISIVAQEKKENENKEDKVEKKDKSKSIADLTKSSKKIDGLFPIFQDTINGKLKMVISKDQFEKEFIYFSQIADGVVEAGRYRGSYQNEIIFLHKKIFR